MKSRTDGKARSRALDRRRKAIVCPTLLLVAAAGLAQAPNQAMILDGARKAALNYSHNLPNFLCNESIARYDDVSDNGRWVAVDQLTVEVSFSGSVEHYRLIARNGRPTELTLNDIAGTLTTGEFGSALMLIFHPDFGTAFEWQRWETVQKRRLAVFKYQVSAGKSHYTLKAGQQSAVVGFHGTVAIEPVSGAVFQWSIEAEPPKGHPMTRSMIHLEYDYRKIEGADYLLPVRAEMQLVERPLAEEQVERLPLRARAAARRPQHHRNVVEFKGYRKFGVDSSITFK